MGVASPFPRGLSTSTHCATTLSFVALLLALAAAATAQTQQQPAPARAGPDAARGGNFNNNSAANATQHSAPRPSSAVARTGKELFQLLANAGVSLIWLPCDLELSPDDAPAGVELSRNVTVEGGDGSGGAAGGGATEAAAEVAARNGTLQLTTLDFAFLVSKLRLAPGATLTLRRLEVRRATSRISAHMDFMAASPGAAVRFEGTLQHRLVCLPEDMGVYNVITLPPAAEHEDVTAAALAGSAERGGGGGAGAPSSGGAAGPAAAPSGRGQPPRQGKPASETPVGAAAEAAAAEVAAAEGQGQGRAPPRPRVQQVQLVTDSKLCWRTSPPPEPAAPQPAAATDAAGSTAAAAPLPPLPPRTSRQALRPPAPPLGAPAPAAPQMPGSLAPTPAPAPASAPVSSALTEASGLVKAADESGRTCASYFVEMRDVRLMTQLMSLANNGGYSVTFINASVVCDMQISRDCMATMGAERCMYDMVSAHDPSYGNAYGALGNASGTAAGGAAAGDPPRHGSGRLGLVVGVSVGGGAVLAAALLAAAFLLRRRRPHWLRVAGSGGSGSSGVGGGAEDCTCERRRKHPLASDGDGGGGPTSGGDPPSPRRARGAHSSAEPEAAGAAGSRRLLADLPPRPPSAPAAIVATAGGDSSGDPSSSSRLQEDPGATPGLGNVFLSRNLSGNPGSSNPSGQPSTSRGRRGAHALAQACQELLKDPARAEAVRWRLAASRPAPPVQLLELIGSGTFGRVYRGLWQGTVVAVKVLVLPPALMGGCEGGERLRRMAAMEAAVSDMARHPCVVQTYSYSFSAIGGVSISGSGSRDVGGGGGGGGGAALPRAPSLEGPNPSWGIPAGPPLGCELQLVLEYCDLGTLRQALDRGAFHLPPGPPPERPYGSRSAADVSDGSTDRSYDARPRGGGRGGSGRDGASGGDGGGGGGASGRPRWRYGLVLQVAYDVASGLMHLHSYDIVHGDVKAGNVLLSSGPAASRASSTALSHTPSSTAASARPPPRLPPAPAPAPAMRNARIPAAALEGAGLAAETAGGAAAEARDSGGGAPPGGPRAGPCQGAAAAAAAATQLQRAATATPSPPLESREEALLPRLSPAAKRASSLDVAAAPSAASGSGSRFAGLGSRAESSSASSFPQLPGPPASVRADTPDDIAAAAAPTTTAMRASTPEEDDPPPLSTLPPPAPPSPPSPPSPPKRDNSLDAAPVSTRISGLSSAPSPSGASSAAALPPPPASVAATAAISTPAASPALAAARTSVAHAPFASAFSVASGVYLDTLDFHSGDDGFGLAAGDIGWMAETEAVGAVAAPNAERAPTGLAGGGGGGVQGGRGMASGGGTASGGGRCSGAGGGGGPPPLELPAGFMAKIADFGLATHLDERHHGTHLSASSAQGTVTHTAPELLLYGHISKHVDTYAYGILLYELLTGERPFRGVTRALLPQLVAVQGLRPELPPDTPPDFRRLAESCWHADPRRRPTFEKVLARVQGMRQRAAAEAAAAGGAAL
ncbi:hypothetical protein HYH03_006965 [Edaphochlamys debaryana]|uniref:Protein kinase domain-containing protein n=1 Tax=Edaphochlamys debaryana TaxID=47281 RepID=A0A835Y335_9CHLO|nr:hypothetical protein HYH03_006965 [Edaphochlamys debaryana]|eukprot:KAG2495033.1 hypothetical protein HYH03_006965 [Edaphochlamys debaryana]